MRRGWRSPGCTRGGKSSARFRTAERGALRFGLDGLDVKVLVLRIGPPDRRRKMIRVVRRDLDAGLAREDLDLADRPLRHIAAPAQERDQPLRIGVLRPADVHREPHATLASRLLRARLARRPRTLRLALARLVLNGAARARSSLLWCRALLAARPHRLRHRQLLGSRPRFAAQADERGGEIAGRA